MAKHSNLSIKCKHVFTEQGKRSKKTEQPRQVAVTKRKSCAPFFFPAHFTCNATVHASLCNRSSPNHAHGMMRTVHNDLLAMSPACRKLPTTISASTFHNHRALRACTIADRRPPPQAKPKLQQWRGLHRFSCCWLPSGHAARP